MPLRGGGRRLMANAILNFHFDYWHTSLIHHPPTSHLTFFPPHNSNSTLQTCRDQWEVVRGWELGWISKTQRRWTLFGNWRNRWLRVWTLGFILVFFSGEGVSWKLGRWIQVWKQISSNISKGLQVWVLSWKRPSSLPSLGRLLGRDQKGFHQGIFTETHSLSSLTIF